MRDRPMTAAEADRLVDRQMEADSLPDRPEICALCGRDRETDEQIEAGALTSLHLGRHVTVPGEPHHCGKLSEIRHTGGGTTLIFRFPTRTAYLEPGSFTRVGAAA